MTQLAVLYVDDDRDIRHIVNLALSFDPRITCRIAESGAEALELLDSGWTPDVAVLDVMMPGMDGPALLQRIRARPETADLPILFLTARGRPADIADYYECGATGVIIKPFDPVRLADDIRAAMMHSDKKSISSRP
jgi:CheY-like chemotaxis protein